MCAFFSLIKIAEIHWALFMYWALLYNLIYVLSLTTKPSYNIKQTLGLAKFKPRGYIIIHYMIVYSLQQGEKGRKEKNRFE